ncbi:MAG: hypothetical protein RIE08_10440 [Acidimicrobiales bacterium]
MERASDRDGWLLHVTDRAAGELLRSRPNAFLDVLRRLLDQ